MPHSLTAPLAMQLPQPPVLLAIILVIFLAIGIHEYAHAKAADMAGDPTPRLYGRVTLDLTKHFELFGTIMIIITSISGFGIGWGKPVPMDPRKMHNPRWDHFTAVAAGPISNLIQAAIFAVIVRGLSMAGVFQGLDNGSFAGEFLRSFLLLGVILNIGLFLFNLIPLGPLDGMWLLGTFLPDPIRVGWTRWNLQIGSFVFLAIVIIGQIMPGPGLIGMILFPLQEALLRILLGT